MIRHSMHIADAVLSLIEYLWETDTFAIDVLPYQNGREHGWAILATSNMVAFSEDRNSDNIVIYYGKMRDFDPQGYTPDDATYRNRAFYPLQDIYGAAQYIVSILRLG